VIEFYWLSYRYLEHATDAFIEVKASSLEEAFVLAARSVVETILDMNSVEEKTSHQISVTGKDLNYLLYNWLEEMIILTITDGFATKSITVRLEKNGEYRIVADLRGESIDIKKHHFKVEIKAPTFHLMEIKQDGGILMRYLLDL
jgi:SHS2 domain-containing protein